jgi:hypothetical protein
MIKIKFTPFNQRKKPNSAIIIFLLILPLLVSASVYRIEITSRQVVSNSQYHSHVGPYEVIKGIIYLEVDPDNSANWMIVDLTLAERNERGNIEFFTEFELHKPVDPEQGNHRLMYFVNNRGRKMAIGHFSHQAGKNWHYSQGYSYLWCGWNCDVSEDDRRFNIHVPVITDNGKTITGKIYSQIYSYADDIVYSLPLVWGGSTAYPPVDLDDPEAYLTMRQYPWDNPVEIPRDQWSFGRWENSRAISDPGYLYIKKGFIPGWLYDLVYTGKDPKVTGLGLAAIRDVVSFFKYEDADEKGQANPLAGSIEYAFAWGHSQSGRLLNHFVYQDFNGDEQKRIVFDGIISNCPGAGKGLFNSRFAQTTRHGSHLEDNFYPIDFFPFASVEQMDPLTRVKGDGLAGSRMSGFLPKIFYINSSTDYWTRAASLLHTDVVGKTDIEIDPNVRIYAVAGRAHTDARIGLIGRALLTALDHWVSHGVEPPESCIPRISDGTLVSLEEFRETFPKIPGCELPDSYYHPLRLDLGSRWTTEGIADNVPPKTGPRFVCLVPQVDEDGNEIAGIRLPEISVPLATFTGWSLRSPSFSRTLRRNAGRVWPLTRTAKEREEMKDPRKSIAERYPTKEAYLSKVKSAVQDLLQQRFLLKEDADMLVEQVEIQTELMYNLRYIEDVAMGEGAEAGLAYFNKFRNSDIPWVYHGMSSRQFMNRVNTKGYELMSAGKLDKALEVFKLNTMIFSRDWNVWDSLAECYYEMGNEELSKQYYEKSLELNPSNSNAVRMLKELQSE